MQNNEKLKFAKEYKNKLLQHGNPKVLFIDNPDRLSFLQLQALSFEILNKVNNLDISLGYEPYDTGMEPPPQISNSEREDLFVDFLDWYEILQTLNHDVFNFVIKNYPVNKCPRILCVGDGENCHLGRKLAMKGYQVVSVDPVARKEFSSNRNKNNQERKVNGNLHIVQGEFFDISTDMINWANLIVGSKIPCCAESLIGLNKPAVFNISGNAEVHNMRFKGKRITSSKQLTFEIMKCKGVRVERTIEEFSGRERLLFICNEREYGEVGERD
ncbi:MAG: hypothetical protein E7310_05945 [Clostridiales bacterium]|nr:hypothetical protein [Clostridiales bacterium]